MFTGLVEATGVIQRIHHAASGARLEIVVPAPFAKVRVGDSIAVNGCCLTVAQKIHTSRTTLLCFDLLEVTWQLTNFRFLQTKARVNLEKALTASSLLGGHLVSGHIHGTGTIRCWRQQGPDYRLEIEVPPTDMKYLMPKGSVAVDGISLTVAEVGRDSFVAWIIPHTRKVTHLNHAKEGNFVNIEFDNVSKQVVHIVERFLAAQKA